MSLLSIKVECVQEQGRVAGVTAGTRETQTFWLKNKHFRRRKRKENDTDSEWGSGLYMRILNVICATNSHTHLFCLYRTPTSTLAQAFRTLYKIGEMLADFKIQYLCMKFESTTNKTQPTSQQDTKCFSKMRRRKKKHWHIHFVYENPYKYFIYLELMFVCESLFLAVSLFR